MMESKTRMLGASRHAGMILVALTAFGVSNLYAEDTGQPFPLRLLATCLQTNSAGTLSSFSDLDAAVAAGFDRLSNSVMVVYPPGRFAIPQDAGLFVFSTNGEIAANIDWLEPTTALGVPLYKMGVIETQLTERSWIYMGVSDGTNCLAFRTNAVPTGFDPQAWVRSTYGDPPAYLSGTDLTEWYADHERNRAILGLTLISTAHVTALQDALQAAEVNSTNAPGADPAVPLWPADTTRLSFANVWVSPSSPSTLNTWIYSPASRPVAVLSRTNLVGASTDWRMRGCFNATPPFNLWHASMSPTASFFLGGFLDQDSDADGIPDLIELKVTGTNPYQWDSAGSSLGDYARYFIYDLSTTNRDANGDGMDDDEAIQAGLNPNAWNTGAGNDSIRYYYDADDRVAGAFSGSPAGAANYKLSPAGNHASTTERSAP
jgi:hypothetical protein